MARSPGSKGKKKANSVQPGRGRKEENALSILEVAVNTVLSDNCKVKFDHDPKPFQKATLCWSDGSLDNFSLPASTFDDFAEIVGA